MRAYVFRIERDGRTIYPVAVMAMNYNEAISQIQNTAGISNYSLIHITNPTPRVARTDL
jgi:hypothetical protein